MAEQTNNYMVFRCEACGQLYIVHSQRMREGLSCRACEGGPLVPKGYAIMMDKRPADIAVKVEVDTSDMEKVRSMLDEIKISVDDMIKNLTETKESLKHGADC